MTVFFLVVRQKQHFVSRKIRSKTFPVVKQGKISRKKKKIKTTLEEIKKVLENKNFGRAETLLREYLSAGADRDRFYEAEFMLGYVFLSQNRPREALEQFRDISLAKPPHRRSPDATYMAAEIYRKKFGDMKKAERFYVRYLNRWPQGRLAKRIEKKMRSGKD
ncbi:MAG: tetratricopeptide repeat protein [Elusimicrobia bacterium]|nr:tetratricopeptide repeat protein [Elusimicrobiota bacterium]